MVLSHVQVEILSHDHKPNNELELKRICDGGGYVEYNRVNGNLALSRALGDFVFKRNGDKIPEEQIVTAYPDIEERTITEDWEFAVLACDGIWDVMRNEEVKQFVRRGIAAGRSPELICEELMQCCLAPDCLMGGLGGDNMTVVLVCFLHNRPYEDLVARCASSLNAPELTFASMAKRQSVLQMTEAQRVTRERRAMASDENDDDDDDDEENDEEREEGDDAEHTADGEKLQSNVSGGETLHKPNGVSAGSAMTTGTFGKEAKNPRPTVRKGVTDEDGDDEEVGMK